MNYVALILVCLLILFCALVIWNKRKQKRYIEEVVKESFGKPIDLEEDEAKYRNERYMKHLSFYTRMKGSLLDDTTKADIDFNQLFAKMNHTYSSVGEEYLFYLLCNPCMSDQKLEQREKMITYFQNNKDLAIELQTMFTGMGKSEEISMFQYLEYLQSVEGKSLQKHVLSLVGIIITVVLSIIQPKLGLVPMFVVMTANVLTYWSNRQFAHSIMGSIRRLEAMIQVGAVVTQYENEELHDYSKRLELSRKYKKVLKNSDIIFSEKTSLVGDADAILDYLRMLTHFDYVKLFQIMSKLQDGYKELYNIAETLGELESVIAIASFRESLEYYTVPILHEQEAVNLDSATDDSQRKEYNLVMDELYHPLITYPIANTLHTKQGVLLTGSNASGKSTFLRTIAINAICAQTIHTCFAKRYESSFYMVRSAMSLNDSLENGDSYFIVEIETIRDILKDYKDFQVMCFVDEILRGTNTIERIAAATEILRYMNTKGILCFAASHDIELTKLLIDEYDMYHFQEYIIENRVDFDYVLYPGPVTTRNAIRLLEMKEYDEVITNNAMDLIDYFEKYGEWPSPQAVSN
ncbi:MAG: hypothetical protein KIC94_02315 [Clostridiales bacterium]|nr:hypothetical protein [Clostridiales bacterium]